jgi:hypothetical protein
MTRFATLCALAAIAAAGGCHKAAPPDDHNAPPAKADLSLLQPLPAVDLVGYVSGHYRTGGNNPAIYADLDRKMFVMMGKRGTAELPLAKPDEVGPAFAQFLVAHGYAANGVQPTDDHAKVVIDGKQMVVVTTDEIFPKMPDELKAHFTPAQLELLYHTRPRDCFEMVAAKYPVIWAYSESLEVLGPGFHQEFPIAQASEAFAAYRKLIVAKP